MDLNKTEVYKIAMKMEENGVAFYTKASEFVTDPSYQNVFRGLAKMEKDHYNYFSKLETEAKDDDYFDSEELAEYLGNHFGSDFFKIDDSEKIGKEVKTIHDIFQYALDRENDSVTYYSIIKKMIHDEESQKSLDKIIEEEKEHARSIQSYIDKIKQ